MGRHLPQGMRAAQGDFRDAWLTGELKTVACRICGRAGVDFAKTSTGFAPSGYTLEKAKEVYEAGCTRFGATATAATLDAWKAELDANAT